MGRQMGGKYEFQRKISKVALNLFWKGISPLTSKGEARKYRVGVEDRMEKAFVWMGKGPRIRFVESAGREESQHGERGYLGLESWRDQRVHCQICLQNSLGRNSGGCKGHVCGTVEVKGSTFSSLHCLEGSGG